MNANAPSMWDSVSTDTPEDRRRSLVATASVAAANAWGFVLAAVDPADFDNRLALMAKQVDAAVAEATDDPVEAATTREALVAGWRKDWRAVRPRKPRQAHKPVRNKAKQAIHVDFDDGGEDVERVLLLPPEGEGVSHWTPPPKRAAQRKTSMALRDFAFEKGIDAAALVEAMQALNPEFPKQKRNWGEIALQTLMDMQFPTDWLELAAQSMMQVVGNSYGSANSWGEEHWHNTRGHTGLPRDPRALLDDCVARSSQAVASAPRSVPRRPVGGDLGRLAASRAFRRIAAEVVADVPPAQSESKPPEGADVDIATIEIGQVITDEVDGKTHSYTVTDVADQGESVLVSVTKDDGETMDLDIPKSEKVHVTSDSFGAPEESETPAQEKAKEKAEKKNKSSDSKSKKDKSSDEDEDEDEDSEDSSEDDDKGKKKAALGELTKAIEALTTLANQYLPENNPYVDGGDVLDEPLAEVAPPPPPAPPADPEPVEPAPLVEPAGDGTVAEV